MRERAQAIIEVTRQNLGIQTPSNRREKHNNVIQQKERQSTNREQGPVNPKPAEQYRKS
jgi:hypothetical protein